MNTDKNAAVEVTAARLHVALSSRLSDLTAKHELQKRLILPHRIFGKEM